MIRYVDLGKQLAVDETDSDWPEQFAFFSTVSDQFVVINGYVVFNSLEDLMMELGQDEHISAAFVNRLLRLLPPKVVNPTPRTGLEVVGLDLKDSQ